MHSTKPMPAICKYGNVFAPNLHTLGELVNHQITKGFQPVGNVQAMEHGTDNIFVQTMVQYCTRPTIPTVTTITKSKNKL